MNCRKNVSQMTNAEKEAFVDAVIALKNTPITQADQPAAWNEGARNRYDMYVYLHRIVGSGAHRGPAFAPWHREFLRQFELELQQVSGNPKITVPYWDWVEYRSSADNSADSNGIGAGFPFTDNFMGGMGTGADNRVETGKFAESAGLWTINVRTGQAGGAARDNTTYLRRLNPQNGNDLPGTNEQNHGLTRANYDAAPLRENPANLTITDLDASFRKSLEYFLHNGPHAWVGGNMMPSTSPNDPVFFLHHCNVDKLWAIWQQRNPGGINNYHPANGLAGHDLNSPMNVLEQTYFVHPALPRPQQLLNHKSLGFMYDTDLPEISLLTPTVNFGEVVENTVTYLPVRFNVETCRKVKFVISALGGNAAFEVPDITVPYEAVVNSNEGEPQTARVFIKLNAVTGTGVIMGTATIEAYIEDNLRHYSNVSGDFLVGTWNVNFQTEIIERPKSAVCLVLDKSGSMSRNDGTTISRFDMMENSVSVIKNILRPDDGIGMVYYDRNDNRLFDIVSMSGGGNNNVDAALGNNSLNPGGSTAIGKGMITAADVLNDEINRPGSPYTNFGMLVLTDGNENVSPYVSGTAVSTALSGLENDVYAVGIGNQGAVSDAALSAISNYLLITGEMQDDERLFRLTNYFVQILADIKKNDIVLDPTGRLIFGLKHEIEYHISEADIDSEIIILSPYAPFFEAVLISPDGNVIRGNSTNVQHFINRNSQIFRVSYPALPSQVQGSHAGLWKVGLEISQEQFSAAFKKFFRDMKPELIKDFWEKLRKYGSVPYSLSVQSFTDLKFKAQVTASLLTPGSQISLNGLLHQYRLPISGQVRAEVTLPDGREKVVRLQQTEKGKFSAIMTAETSGVYQFRIIAQGYSMGGKKFTRETLRSVSIYKNTPTVPTEDEQKTPDWCKLADCLLSQKEIKKYLKQHKIDAGALKKCLIMNCEDSQQKRLKSAETTTLKDSDTAFIQQIQPFINLSGAEDMMASLPEMKSIEKRKQTEPEIPKEPMMMPAFKLTGKGELKKIDFAGKPARSKRSKKK